MHQLDFAASCTSRVSFLLPERGTDTVGLSRFLSDILFAVKDVPITPLTARDGSANQSPNPGPILRTLRALAIASPRICCQVRKREAGPGKTESKTGWMIGIRI